MSENLISQNPVQRFKQGIQKFQNGGTSLPKNEVISDSPTESYRRRRNKLFGDVAGKWIPILKKNGGLLSKNPVTRFKKGGNFSLGKFKIDTKKCTIIKLANKQS